MSELQDYEQAHKEDEIYRVRRIEEVGLLFPIPEDGLAVGGGIETGIALVEARRAYVEGLWLCTVFAATAAIERHIAAALHAVGDHSASTLDTLSLMERAAALNHISAFEKAKFAEIAKVRTKYARFREPLEMVEELTEAGERGLGINEILQDDARMALTLAASYLQRYD